MKFNLLRDVFVAICFLLLLLLIALKLQSDATAVLAGAFRAADGDSLVHAGRRLRLVGIDAPELGQTCRRKAADWPCGRAARDALAAKVRGGDVSCRGDRDDRYGRLLVTCQAAGRNINRDMVAEGMAFAFGDYDREESAARDAGLGLWAGEAMRPSDWRRRHQAGMAEEAPHVPSFIRRFFSGF
jgi:endonuclease YncB( thermonuclease family)